jgi:hypothetical protein
MTVCSEPGCPNLRPCPVHPKPAGRYGTRNPDRDLVAHNRWARAVKRRDNWTCQRCGYQAPKGLRLGALGAHPMHAHHVRPGYNIDDGITLCAPCHRDVDPHAR